MIRKIAIATAVAACAVSIAHAATLTGDTITQTDPTGTYTVLAGVVDLVEGNVTFDYAAGANGDELIISVGPGNFSGIYANSGTSTITLSDLNFSGGEALTGFTVLSAVYQGNVDILSPTSLALSFADGPITGPQ